MRKARRLSIVLTTAMLAFVTGPAAAMKADDPVGDVPEALDIAGVSLVWNDTKVTGRVVTADTLDPTLLESSGTVQASILTRESDGSYLYSHDVLITKYDDGDLYGWLTRRNSSESEPEYSGPVAVSMPDERTLKFVVKRSKIAGDKEGSSFAFWFATTYSNADEGCPNYSCVDYAPDGDEMYVKRW